MTHPNRDPAIDRDELLGRMDHDLELLRELVELFLCDLEARIDGIRDACARQDLPLAHERAHALKGSVANFAAKGAWEAAKRVDDLARSNTLEGLEVAVQQMQLELARLRIELEQILKENP